MADNSNAVNTKQVTGRRDVHYDSFDDVLSDVEQLASGNTKTLGNWSFGQILSHMAKSVNAMIDGSSMMLPAPVRWLMSLLMKKSMLSKTMSPGFKIPKAAATFLPDDITPEEGINRLRTAIARLGTTDERALNGVFGKLTKDECDQFQLRHFEMHMSFVVPADA